MYWDVSAVFFLLFHQRSIKNCAQTAAFVGIVTATATVLPLTPVTITCCCYYTQNKYTHDHHCVDAQTGVRWMWARLLRVARAQRWREEPEVCGGVS